MDVLTHGLVGAAVSTLKSSKVELRQAAIIGFLSGIAADADTLIRSSSDPLLTLEYHRHFSHSLFFIPVGGLVMALVLWPIFRKRIPRRDLFVYATLGYCLSGVLDAMTSYGTFLLWPLVDARIQFSIISIVDPIITIVLVVGLAISVRKNESRFALVSLVVVAAYLTFSGLQKMRADKFYSAVRDHRGHAVQDIVLKPTFGNVLLWRGVYEYDGKYFADGIRAGLQSKLYVGESRSVYSLSEQALSPEKYQLVERFSDLSQGYLVSHPDDPDVVGDARYAMDPTKIKPIWGISTVGEESHFLTFRRPEKLERQRFLSMLLGGEI